MPPGSDLKRATPSEPGRRELDDIDRRILRLLQTHGRATNQWLASEVDLSPTPCLERVRRLERDGYIQSYQAVLSPELVGYPMLIFAFVLFDRAVDGVYERFRAAIADIEEIVECHMITGDVDFVMKIRVAHIAAFRQLLEERILKLPGVRITHSYVAMDEVKVGVSTPVAG